MVVSVEGSDGAEEAPNASWAGLTAAVLDNCTAVEVVVAAAAPEDEALLSPKEDWKGNDEAVTKEKLDENGDEVGAGVEEGAAVDAAVPELLETATAAALPKAKGEADEEAGAAPEEENKEGNEGAVAAADEDPNDGEGVKSDTAAEKPNGDGVAANDGIVSAEEEAVAPEDPKRDEPVAKDGVSIAEEEGTPNGDVVPVADDAAATNPKLETDGVKVAVAEEEEEEEAPNAKPRKDGSGVGVGVAEEEGRDGVTVAEEEEEIPNASAVEKADDEADAAPNTGPADEEEADPEGVNGAGKVGTADDVEEEDPKSMEAELDDPKSDEEVEKDGVVVVAAPKSGVEMAGLVAAVEEEDENPEDPNMAEEVGKDAGVVAGSAEEDEEEDPKREAEEEAPKDGTDKGEDVEAGKRDQAGEGDWENGKAEEATEEEEAGEKVGKVKGEGLEAEEEEEKGKGEDDEEGWEEMETGEGEDEKEDPEPAIFSACLGLRYPALPALGFWRGREIKRGEMNFYSRRNICFSSVKLRRQPE